ncbi:DNA damage-inducible protein D [Cupriavidus taiwanensis]|uniref:DNA damage-inducible protein D n=1 Tax=Cupriavidus taiwanensis TaxID=164546 RepID=UPI000E103150|nr:DNA damage-inducible protein D [Cupriavidus taiwanensis]SPA47505.1 DNA-damage-inducible protein [Cupriavidus taiwanensis]
MSDTIDGAPSAPSFERIRQVGSAGEEYWFARELAPLLDYQDWRNFVQVVEKAKIACTQSGHEVPDHFGDTTKMVQIGSSAKRPIADFRLSRYACYLIVQNGDPSKPVIANGQTYFALQTRRQELAEASRFRKLSEDGRRLMLRGELTEHNKALTAAAKSAGVETAMDYAVFQDHGYKGLYGGFGAKDIHASKGLKKSQKILDHMGSTELAANLFRATQTEEKLRRESVQGKKQANHTHYEVGAKVRQTIADLGGTMPEKLPTPEKSIKQIEREQRRLQNDSDKSTPENF